MTNPADSDHKSPQIERPKPHKNDIDDQFEEQAVIDKINRLLRPAGVAAEMVTPAKHGDLLVQIISAAGQFMNANAAVLLLLDPQSQMLEFEVALGELAAEVKVLGIPIGTGIAGLAAIQKQPIFVADLATDPRWRQDIGQAVESQPRNMLCVPLIQKHSVIGVLELIDKSDGASFTQKDLGIAEIFARLAATTLSQSQAMQHLSNLLRSAFGNLEDLDAADWDILGRMADRIEGSQQYRDQLEIAMLVGELISRSKDSAALIRHILDSLRIFFDATATDAVIDDHSKNPAASPGEG